MLGFYGKVIFETSDKRIMNFSGFTRSVSSNFADHQVIGGKAKTEYISPGLDTLTFAIDLNGNYGVKPRDEMNIWVDLARRGNAETMAINGKPLGVDKWIVTSVSQAWGTLMKNGELFSGKIDVTLKEYVSTSWRPQ